MTVAVAAPAVVTAVHSLNRREYIGTIAIGASPLTYATGGLVLDFTGLVKSTKPPLWVEVYGIAGFIYSFIPDATACKGLLMIFCEGTVATNAPLVEHTAAAVVAGVSGDTIRFRGVFTKI